MLVSAAIALLLITNRQTVLDQFALWHYQPDANVSALADRTTMTDTGRRAFYASHPALETAQTFNAMCGNNEQGTAVLGCYTHRQIYIYNVSDAQLDGVREVTAAHEMLHAAYDRMSSKEQARIDTLLEAEYQKLSKDAAFADRMAYYAKVEPGERDNELHSIIGTEVSPVSNELEAHYRQYFSNRSAVVALHDKYSSIFTQLKQQSDALSSRLDVLATSIDQATAAYNDSSKQLNQQIIDFNRRATNGEFTSQADFSAERRALAARSEQLASNRQAITNMISEYNQLRDQLVAIATQTDALNRSIDSTLAPAPSL